MSYKTKNKGVGKFPSSVKSHHRQLQEGSVGARFGLTAELLPSNNKTMDTNRTPSTLLLGIAISILICLLMSCCFGFALYRKKRKASKDSGSSKAALPSFSGRLRTLVSEQVKDSSNISSRQTSHLLYQDKQ
jgi:hypothetical protein